VAWAASVPLPSLTHVSVAADAVTPQLHRLPPPWKQQPYNPQQPLPPQQQAGQPEVLAGFITGKWRRVDALCNCACIVWP
jgi:hypothetical protein